MLQTLYLKGFEAPQQTAADRNRTFRCAQNPHRKESFAVSVPFVQTLYNFSLSTHPALSVPQGTRNGGVPNRAEGRPGKRPLPKNLH